MRSKKEQREYEENIKNDVLEFQREVAGIKRPEFPVGDTKEWRKKREKKKGRKYDKDKDKE